MDTNMETNVHQTLYPLVRDYMNAMGTSRTTLVAIKSYIDAVQRLKCTPAEFKPLLLELNAVIRSTEPTVVPLVHIIEEFEAEMQPFFDKGLDAAKAKATEILGSKLKRFEADTQQLTQCCTDFIEQGDFIVVHSPTGYIRNAFVRAHTELKKAFQVLILKQDFHRTKDLVSTLGEHKVKYLLIPEHNLSHYLEQADKLFISAVTITADGKAVTGPGTANVVSICHAYKVPVYLFAESIKFSHRSLPDQCIHKEECYRVEGDYYFQITAFSHDFVDLKMVDHLVTEKGETAMEKSR
ncbi:MAG: hypothetical protein C4519_02050 [Desulfobacteraceae bacterium]|nr:MAG: hypothetical protein C4519_02050 [Desulfobacteraceae bacterium]